MQRNKDMLNLAKRVSSIGVLIRKTGCLRNKYSRTMIKSLEEVLVTVLRI